ncbi:MAG: hypothetical protein ACRD12_17525 [Acidimicrobiales bacterium]
MEPVSRPPRQACSQVLLEEERELHRRLVAREQKALLDCFDRIGQLVFCVASLQTADRAGAENLTEALFVELWRAPESFPPARGPLGLQMIARLADRIGAPATCPN